MTISSTPIRVMIVDDHTMVRLGLATFLKLSMTCNWQAKLKVEKLLSGSARRSSQM